MPNDFYLRGLEAFDAADYQAAKQLFLNAINQTPEDSDSYFFLSKSHFFCDEKDAAITYLKQYIALNQHNPEKIANVSYAFDLLGQCYEAENKFKAAFTSYITATTINPQAESAWHNLGLLYIRFAQSYLENNHSKSDELFQKAKISIRNALNICATNPMFLHSIAGWYEKYIELLQQITEDEDAVQSNINETFNEAIGYYEQALNQCHDNHAALKQIITSNFSECLAQYGHFLYQNDRFETALTFYSRGLAQDSEHMTIRYQIGMSLVKLKRYPEALTCFLNIVEHPASTPEDKTDALAAIADINKTQQDSLIISSHTLFGRSSSSSSSAIDSEENDCLNDNPSTSLAPT